MATVLLSAAGAAIGGSVGGTLAGLSSVAIGRAVGATLGRVIDQRVMGSGARAVETGKVDRFRITRSGEGNPLGRVFGRTRVGGQVIWASDFTEVTKTTGGGGKGAPQPQPQTTSYCYTVSLAVALGEGEIARVGRVWADGEEISTEDLNMRVYTGSPDQLPDPGIEAIEGAGNVPAYRGTSYVVFEDLPLDRFGNRVPQFSFEVSRPEPAAPTPEEDALNPARATRAVALMPGTGEYALATTPVYYTDGPGSRWPANTNTPAARTDFSLSLEALGQEVPNVEAASLIVSWFGTDLRCAQCAIRPRPEKLANEGENMPWSVAGLSRAQGLPLAPTKEDEPLYGGTPADAAVIEAIKAMQAAGQAVMFYPFILMDQEEGNALPDPYSDAGTQPHLPWRGRITTSKAPGQPGSPDQTAAASAEVNLFFGTARASDFTVASGTVSYTGPAEWSFSRFILHYAALCAAAGGVDAFCIGSEMRGMTQVRGAGGSFPFVAHLRTLAGEARALLGAGTKISYAADWSEYFGYQPQDGTGDRLFHLDPLWADTNIDFIGIDHYMPLADWREGEDHLDAQSAPAIYDLDYLRGNIEGGEGYDWYYHSPEAEAAQIRTPITDAAHSEPWVWRYKDIRNWWLNPHHERIGGVRQPSPTAWVPQSKPFWFTEYGCAAIDKGANQPNKFLDPKSSESAVPKYSTGARDDLMQMQYLRAFQSYYAEAANNPVSEVYGAPMVDMGRAFVWAWDARPYPFFPNNRGLWSDGENYARGHWVTGRMAARPLASVVEEICARAGVTAVDTSALYGVVRGFAVEDVASARAVLQPLMLAYGFDAVERDGLLRFVMRRGTCAEALDEARLARSEDLEGLVELTRDPELEMSGRVRVSFVEADGDFEILSEEAVLPDDATHGVARTELPLTLTRAEGRQIAERFLAEARIARDAARFALPPSRLSVGAGDVVSLPCASGGNQRWRVDRVEQGAYQILDAVRIDPSVYRPADFEDEAASVKPFAAPVPVTPLFMDLPLMRGDEVPHAPHIAATATPWPGSVAVYQSALDSNYLLNSILAARSVIGTTLAPMAAAAHGVWDRGAPLEVELISGTLERAERAAVLAGANLAAIGDGSTGNWELFQFAEAELVDTRTWWLSDRLRGQLGSDGLMPASWPAGSWFVLMNGVPSQIDLSANLRQVSQHFRIGPAQRGYDDPSYRHLQLAFDGNGLRPYAPVHLRAGLDGAGNLSIAWVRRSRIEGDSWEGEVPLGEESEAYRLRVMQAGSVLREVEVTSPGWIYPAALQAQDGVSGGAVELRVAQLSARYGAGLEQSMTAAL